VINTIGFSAFLSPPIRISLNRSGPALVAGPAMLERRKKSHKADSFGIDQFFSYGLYNEYQARMK
jgi:hypothetical protein